MKKTIIALMFLSRGIIIPLAHADATPAKVTAEGKAHGGFDSQDFYDEAIITADLTAAAERNAYAEAKTKCGASATPYRDGDFKVIDSSGCGVNFVTATADFDCIAN